MTKIIEIGGPWFEDFHVGQVMPDAPSVTVHSGYAAWHQALFAERLRLALDADLSRHITGGHDALVSPALLCNIAIGQTTYASQRVKANLFYRGLVFKKPVYLGDTLTTTTTVVALKQNKNKEGRPATGMVVLEMEVRNQRDETALCFWRCPMIPCRDPQAETGHDDSLDVIPAEINPSDIEASDSTCWDMDRFREKFRGEHFAEIEKGTRFLVQARDTVTSAPELVRMTLNMATTHTDAKSSVYNRRLVYGGHTISMAAAQLTRALPNLVTFLAWRGCDHTAPVFEDDILRSEISVVDKQTLRQGGFLDLHVEVFAERGGQAPESGNNIKVLDWKPLVLMA